MMNSQLAHRFAYEVVHGVCGHRQTEVTIDALFVLGGWLRDEGILPANALPAMRQWRVKLKAEWTELVGEEVEPSRPRHSEYELHRLFANMHDVRVDPRFALAFDLGGSNASDRFSALFVPMSTFRLSPAYRRMAMAWVCSVASESWEGGKKKASPIVLTADQRRSVDRALSGYLSDFEALYRNGTIKDYRLFPAGRLKAGKAKVVENPKSLGRDGARKMFQQLEIVANVDYVRGRAWYGVKRKATDLAEDVEHDERVLNSVSGHSHSKTRREYQQESRPSVLQQAARTRAKLRAPTAAKRAKRSA